MEGSRKWRTLSEYIKFAVCKHTNFCSSMTASFCKGPNIKQLHGRVYPTLATLANTYTGMHVTILLNVWH